jgi:hypothetical protein
MYAVGADFAPLGLPVPSYRGRISQSGWRHQLESVDNFVPMPVAGPAAVGEVSAC